jgi:cold-inducible RNA-binding protein
MARKLYVGNLPFQTGEQDLQALFATAGTVESVNVMRDTATGRARGFAFVEMASDEDAQNAIRQLNNHQLGGRNRVVRWLRRWPRRRRRRARRPARAALVASSRSKHQTAILVGVAFFFNHLN